MIYTPKATPDLVEGYLVTSDLANNRASECSKRGDKLEAEEHKRLAVYCKEMAELRALDDDQYQRLRKGTRKALEQSMSHADMAREERKGNISAIWWTENLGVPGWKWDAVEKALAPLTTLQRTCFELKVAGRLTYREIAEVLPIAEGEAKVHVSRARKKLEKMAPKLYYLFDEARAGREEVEFPAILSLEAEDVWAGLEPGASL